MKSKNADVITYGKPIQLIKKEVNDDFNKIKEQKNELLFEELIMKFDIDDEVNFVYLNLLLEKLNQKLKKKKRKKKKTKKYLSKLKK